MVVAVVVAVAEEKDWRFGVFFFFFLLWNAASGGGVGCDCDGVGCDCGDLVFFFFKFYSSC